MKERETITLRAGPLSVDYADGELRSLRLGDREVLRRVYAAVRDQNWGTVPVVLSEETILAQADCFEISYRADHRQDDIHFIQQGRLSGNADGTVIVTMNGTAQTGFWRNRIGLCVLHPIRECAGQPCLVTHPDGTLEPSVFPDAIAPHQPFRQVQAIAHKITSGLRAEVTFSGDIFETEDQRNWTDASFKTYSTPLELPFPVWTPAGTIVEQSVMLRLCGMLPMPVPETAGAWDCWPVRITFPDLPPVPLPRLGLGVASHGQPLTTVAVERLRALHLDHLRVDVSLSDPDYPARLAPAASEASALGTRLLVALHLSEAAEAELTALGGLVAGSSWPLGGWLVFGRDVHCTPESSLALARQRLQTAAPDAEFFGGTDAYFAELNRGRPTLIKADGVVYSVNPQVHAFDDTSLMETPAAQAATVQSARRLYPRRAVWVSPVTLRPRFNPAATGPGGPDTVDCRQKSQISAAWTVSSFKHLAEAGAGGVTYFETTGDRGLMEADGNGVFPVYSALAEIGTYAGGEVFASISSSPDCVACLGLRRGLKIGLILANLTAKPQHVMLEGRFAGKEQRLPPYGVSMLTENES